MKILKFKRGELLVELEVDEGDWAARSVHEQHDLINKAFECAAKEAAVEKSQLVTFRKAQETMTTEEKFEKLATDFMKGTADATDRYLQLFNSGLELFKSENTGKGINEFVDTENGFQLKEAYEKARNTMLTGPVEAFTKGLNDEAETVSKDIAKQIEEFSLKHNLDTNVARERLRSISPAFQALEKRQAEIPAERNVAVAKAAKIAKGWCDARTAEVEKAAADDASAQSEKRRTQRMSPVEKKFDDRITEIMKNRRLTRPAATNWAIENDATARALYEVSRDERTNGARS
jgi:hypothetical protein